MLGQEQEIVTSIDKLSKSSIELAEASANLGALKVIFGIFVVIVFILLCVFILQTINMNKRVVDIHNASQKVQTYFQNANDKSIGKAQANILIRRVLGDLEVLIKYYTLRYRLEKPVVDEAFRKKAHTLVINEMNSCNDFVMSYEVEGKALRPIISLDDAKVIEDFVIDQLLKSDDQFSVSDMDQSAYIIVYGFRLSALKYVS